MKEGGLDVFPKPLNNCKADLPSGDSGWPNDHLLKIENERFIGQHFLEPRIIYFVFWIMSIDVSLCLNRID